MSAIPGLAAAIGVAQRSIPEGARVLVVNAPDAAIPLGERARRVHAIHGNGPGLADAIAREAPVDAVFFPFPTRAGALIPTLQAIHAALGPSGIAIVSDLVWQTAPTPELIKAFAPDAAGAERVRPIEGYEMQAEHAGYHLAAREDLPRDAWTDAYAEEPAKAEALAKDERGAAKVAVWTLRAE